MSHTFKNVGEISPFISAKDWARSHWILKVFLYNVKKKLAQKFNKYLVYLYSVVWNAHK